MEWDFEQELGDIFRAHDKRKDEASQRVCGDALKASKTAALQVSQRLEKKAGSAFARRITGDMLDLKAERWMHALVLQHKFIDALHVAFEFRGRIDGVNLVIDAGCNGDPAEYLRLPISEIETDRIREDLERFVVERLKTALAV